MSDYSNHIKALSLYIEEFCSFNSEVFLLFLFFNNNDNNNVNLQEKGTATK